MTFWMIVIVEIIRAVVREAVVRFTQFLLDRRKNKNATHKLGQSKKGGRSR